jgi:hypothetical protein
LQVGSFKDNKNITKMKKIKWPAAVAFTLLFTCCNESKKAPETVEENTTAATEAPAQITSAATFTVNNKQYACVEVGAVADKKENTIVITGRSGAEGETVFFSFTVNGIGEGQKKFNAAGSTIEFTAGETYVNSYKENCTGENVVTAGTLTITKLVDYTPEKEGRVEGNFEGQLAVTRPVAPYPCSNGHSANSKTEIVTVKGNFSGGYINTKDVPL